MGRIQSPRSPKNYSCLLNSKPLPGGLAISFKELNINRRIRSPYVRVIGKDGEQLGILDTRQAIQLADGLGLDLVEVANNADPPVCKIMDYGKYKYQEKKKTQEARKKQTVVELKEIQIRPKTEDHDLSHKAKKAVEFLEDGDKVKLIVVYRGREMEHIEMGWETMLEFCQKLEEKAVVDASPRMEGKRLSLIFAPPHPGKKIAPGSLMASLPKNPPPKRGGFGSGPPMQGPPK